MVRLAENSDGTTYVRHGDDILAKPGRGVARIYYPELYQDKAENILSELPEDSVDLIVTDPPYGVGFESNRDGFDGVSKLSGIWNDDWLEFLDGLAEQFVRVLKPDTHVYIFCRWDVYPGFADAFEHDELDPNTVIVWDKKRHGMGDLSTWAPRHEFIIHYEFGSPEIRGKRPKNVLQFTPPRGEIVKHQTQKPRELFEYLIEKSSDPGDLVLDPFGGSYVTARAAWRKGRRSLCCELNPDTHRAGLGLVKHQILNDPEKGFDWTELGEGNIADTAVLDGGAVNLDD